MSNWTWNGYNRQDLVEAKDNLRLATGLNFDPGPALDCIDFVINQFDCEAEADKIIAEEQGE